MKAAFIRACFKNSAGQGMRARRGGWRGATKENIPRGSSSEEQRRQPPRPVARPPEIFLKHALRIILTFSLIDATCLMGGAPPGRVVAWGDNRGCELKDVPSLRCARSYVRLNGQILSNVVMIAARNRHSLALQEDGKILSWGFKIQPIPDGLTNIIAISAGMDHDLALSQDGVVFGWLNTTVPPGLSNIVAIAAGRGESLAIRQDGSLVKWGELWGPPNGVWTIVPPKLADMRGPPDGMSNLVAVAACGSYYGEDLFLERDGGVSGWNWPNHSDTAPPPPGLSNVVAIAVGDAHCLALKKDRTVIAWGYPEDWFENPHCGQTNVPPGLTNVVAIAAGGNSSMALKSDGTVVVWGDNSSHQVDFAAGLSNIVAIAAGGDFCLAIQTNGTITETNIPYVIPKWVDLTKLNKAMMDSVKP